MPEPDGIRKRKVIGFRRSRIRGWYRKTNGKRVPELERGRDREHERGGKKKKRREGGRERMRERERESEREEGRRKKRK